MGFTACHARHPPAAAAKSSLKSNWLTRAIDPFLGQR
jgi:hypothetical protein